MKTAASHQTAGRVLLSERVLFDSVQLARGPLENEKVHSFKEIESACPEVYEAVPKPIHVIVNTRNNRSVLHGVRFHSQSRPLSSDSFWITKDGLCIVRPELCFAQMSSVLSVPQLIKFGIELCATYVPKPLADIGYVVRKPLTSQEELSNLAKGYGAGRQRKIESALPWVVNNSASQRETILYMLLCLPYRLGGYGLPKPVLNYEIPLEKDEARLAGRKLFRADLYWPEFQLDVEYDSTQYHLDERQMEKDAIRRNILNHKGIRVISVTRNQINNREAFDGVARQIAKGLGKRIRPSRDAMLAKQEVLRRSLLENWDYS